MTEKSKQTWLKHIEAMEILGCQRTTLYKLRKDNKLVFSKIGRKVYVSKESIEKLLNENASVFINIKSLHNSQTQKVQHDTNKEGRKNHLVAV